MNFSAGQIALRLEYSGGHGDYSLKVGWESANNRQTSPFLLLRSFDSCLLFFLAQNEIGGLKIPTRKPAQKS
jgi:hypothetical protein